MNTESRFTVIEYTDIYGRSPFARWYSNLDSIAKTRITIALHKLTIGNYSNSKSVGKSVFEFKINFGPGYRIYYATEGSTLIILLYGGTKKRQDRDIKLAQHFWQDYKKRKANRI